MYLGSFYSASISPIRAGSAHAVVDWISDSPDMFQRRQGEDGKVVFEVGAGSWWVPPAMSIHTVDAGETLPSGCEFQSSRNSRIYESKEFSTRSESHSKGCPGQRRSASSQFPGHDRRLGLDASIDDGETSSS